MPFTSRKIKKKRYPVKKVLIVKSSFPLFAHVCHTIIQQVLSLQEQHSRELKELQALTDAVASLEKDLLEDDLTKAENKDQSIGLRCKPHVEEKQG